MRLASWRCPEDFEPEEPVLFAEPLFNQAVAEQLGLEVVEPPEDFLARLPQKYVKREIRLTTAAEARTLTPLNQTSDSSPVRGACDDSDFVPASSAPLDASPPQAAERAGERRRTGLPRDGGVVDARRALLVGAERRTRSHSKASDRVAAGQRLSVRHQGLNPNPLIKSQLLCQLS